MEKSLLAHMYSRIRGSQEDIATYSLEYIVSKSSELNYAFTKLLESTLNETLGDGLHYNCQASGKQKERPNISGVNNTGKEVVLCEAKFYSGLTENQPLTYLERLRAEGGVGLVYICPARRRRILWNKLVELCQKKAPVIIDEYCVAVDGVRMSIVTWSEVIEMLRLAASAMAVEALSDIDQLDGFCKMMDDSSFIPFTEEDFGIENARREERHYQVPDAVVSYMLADKTLDASVRGLRATPNRQGYARYVNLLGHSVSVNYDRPNWGNPTTEETPFWAVIYEKGFKQPETYRQIFRKYPVSYQGKLNDAAALPVFVPVGASLDEIAKDITAQIVKYINDIDAVLGKNKK